MTHSEKAWKRIEELTDRIYGVADIMCMLAELDEETPVKPRTVACAGRIIAHDIARLSSYLADLNISEANPGRG